jgi:hypothetical protein
MNVTRTHGCHGISDALPCLPHKAHVPRPSTKYIHAVSSEGQAMRQRPKQRQNLLTYPTLFVRADRRPTCTTAQCAGSGKLGKHGKHQTLTTS